jgi:hypothetical protein
MPTGFSQTRINGVTSLADNTGSSSYFNRIVDSTHSSPGDHVLWLEKHDRSGVPLANGSNGDYTNPDPNIPYALYSNKVVGRFGGDVGYAGFPGWPHDHYQGGVATLLAKTNPSRPNIVPLSLLQDLWTLPRLIRELGELIRTGKRVIGHKSVANNALAAKFGWIPLLRDVTDLLKVLDDISRRNDEIKKLYSAEGLRRRLKQHDVNANSEDYPLIESGFLGGDFLQVLEVRKSTTSPWQVVVWKPNNPMDVPDAGDMFRMARNAVLGLTASGTYSGAWDLIPWTFLLDWVTNVQDYVLAHGNTVPAQPVGSCWFMEHTQVTYFYSDYHKPSWLTVGSGQTTNDWKVRISLPATPSINAYLPYITGDRLSTLALLAVQRIRL